MRVLVVGPGALGILFAARLAHAGHQVFLGCRNRRRAAGHDGVTAIAPDGTRLDEAVPAVHRPRDLDGPAQMLVLATKIDAAEAALAQWLPALAPTGAVVSLLNGLQGDRIAALVPDRFLACTVAFPATLEGVGTSRQTGPGELIVGPWPDRRMAVVTDVGPVAAVLADVAPTRVHSNMRGVQWTKLLINACGSSLGALTGLDFGDLVEDPRAREAFLRILTEGYRAGRADGVRFEPVNGLRPGLLALPPAGPRWFPRHLALSVVGRRYRAYRSSSLQSVRRGERSEAVHLNGAIAEAGRRNGVPTPVNDAVLHLMAAIDGGRLEPGSLHLDRLLRA